MENYKIILIDSASDIRLLKESIAHLSLPVDFQPYTSLTEAMSNVNIDKADMIMIGSGILIIEGFEDLSNFESIPIIILCESLDLRRFVKDNTCNLCLITRPFDINKIPEIITKAIEFLLSYKER